MTDVIELTNRAQFFELTDNPKVIVDFARKNGCAPCRQLEPHFLVAATKLKDKNYIFARVHLDEVDVEFRDFVIDELNIKSTPTVLFYSYSGLQRELKQRSAPLLIKEIADFER